MIQRYIVSIIGTISEVSLVLSQQVVTFYFNIMKPWSDVFIATVLTLSVPQLCE